MTKTSLLVKIILFGTIALPLECIADNTNRGIFLSVETAAIKFNLTKASVNATYSLEDPSATRIDNSSRGYSIDMGYRFSRYIAIDWGALNYGAPRYFVGYHSILSCSGTICQSVRAEPTSDNYDDTDAVFIRAIGSFPLTPNWALEGRAGLRTQGQSDSLSISSMWGAGIRFRFSQHYSISASYDQLEGDYKAQNQIQAFSFGIGYQY